MSDKEERIVVSKWFTKHMSDDKTTLIILQSQLNDKSMTRAEAVERMEKAMAANDVGGYIILAEAALDALLGGKNA